MPPFVRAQLDYYAVLETDPTSGTAEINAAFRRLAWRYHPDRNPAQGATLQFQDINEAHQVLSDPERRAEYDAQWHHDSREHRRTAPSAPTKHTHRSPRRRRRIRTALMAMFSILFVFTAWAVIFVAISSPNFLAADSRFDAPSSFNANASQGCSISMEMFPVTYTDERGRQSTAWETAAHNCWGGSTWLSSGQSLQQQRAFGNPGRTSGSY